VRLWPRRKVYLDDLPKTHDLRFAVVFLLGLALVLGSLYGVGYAVAGDTVPRGTTVSDVEIGTLSRGEAETELRSELVPRLQRPLTLQSDPRSFPIDPQSAGLTLDVEATVHEAMAGGDWDPRHMLAVVFGGSDVEPIVHVDDEEFAAELGPVVRRLRVEPVDARVTFAPGGPQVRAARAGRTVDLEQLELELAAALRRDDQAVRIPMRPVQAVITTGEARAFVRAVAKAAATRPVRLRVRGAVVTLQPEGFAAALRAVPADGDLRLGIDPVTAFRLGAATRARLPGQPKDASVVLRRGRPVVVPGRAGFRVTRTDWASGVLTAAQRQPGNRVAVLEATRTAPAFSVADAESMRIRSRVGVYSVRFPRSLRHSYVVRAARQLDGAVLRPGGRLSYLRRVGVSGRPRESTVVATAAYNAALLAGLEVTQRSWIPRLPEHLPRGREALALRPRDDLGLDNQLPYGVLLHATVERTRTGGVARVEAWSSRYWQVSLRLSGRKDLTFAPPARRSGQACRPSRGRPAYTIDLARVRQHGQQRRTDVFSSRYAAERGVVCRNR
jgi:vancomycin resistance protein YoaR